MNDLFILVLKVTSNYTLFQRQEVYSVLLIDWERFGLED